MTRHTKPRVAIAVGSRIKACRLDAPGAPSISEVCSRMPADALHVSSVSKYEGAMHCPSIQALLQLALALGVEPARLLPTLAEIPDVLGVRE